MLTYSQARPLIRTGDCIGIATRTVNSALVRAVQRIAGLEYAHITHCAVAHWVGNRLYAVEMSSGGNIYRPLSQYAARPMIVSRPPSGCDVARFEDALELATDSHIPYGVIDLLRIGLRLLPRRVVNTDRWGADGAGDQVCSFYLRWIYAHLGGDVSGIPHLPSPAEVTAALTPKLIVNTHPA